MQIAKNIANSLLVIALLTATVGVTLNKHYCMGLLKSMAVNEHAAHCYDGEAEDIPCCKEISQELRLDEMVQHSFEFNATPTLFEFPLVNFILLKDLNVGLIHEKPNFREYSPPLPDQDIPVLFQSFLI